MGILVLLTTCMGLFGQADKQDEHVFATFGNMAGKDCGDDDFSQVVFFSIPENYEGLFYLRAFDPDCGGVFDRSNGLWETNTIFEVYGGQGCLSELDARQTDPVGNYKSGKILQREIFAKESVQDGEWFSFGPYSAKQGERINDFPGFTFFKLIVEGRTGNDGNIYSLFLSSEQCGNTTIEYTAFFDYERTYPGEKAIMVSRPYGKNVPSGQLKIPIELADLPTDRDYDITVEPIEE